MTAKEILAEGLRGNGLDGLFCEDAECGCLLDDLAPCGDDCTRCEAGHRHDRPAGSDSEYPWIVSRLEDPVAAWKKFEGRE